MYLIIFLSCLYFTLINNVKSILGYASLKTHLIVSVRLIHRLDQRLCIYFKAFRSFTSK